MATINTRWTDALSSASRTSRATRKSFINEGESITIAVDTSEQIVSEGLNTLKRLEQFSTVAKRS